MINTVKQVLKYYLENKKEPTKSELKIEDTSLLERKWSIFITFYKGWNIVWNHWNIMEIENDLVNEIIKNTIWAFNDIRFPNITLNDLESLKIRIDIVKNRSLISTQKTIVKDGKTIENPNYKKITDLNPIKSWILAIRNDYNKLAIILPNISNSITNWKEFVDILSKKLNEIFKEENYIIYEITTDVLTDF